MKFLRLINDFPHDFSECFPFVFTKSDAPQMHVEHTDDILACPERCFTIEVDNGYLTTDKGTNDSRISCIYCEELGPGRYIFIATVEVSNVSYFFKVTESFVQIYLNGHVVSQEENHSLYKDFKAIVNHQLGKLVNCRLGFFNASGKAKFRNNHNVKSTYVPKNVIYISPKNQVQEKTEAGRINVRWTDAWTVICHWRKIAPDSYGVGRDGVRDQLGRTFIKTYSKGNADIEAQLKIRRVK